VSKIKRNLTFTLSLILFLRKPKPGRIQALNSPFDCENFSLRAAEQWVKRNKARIEDGVLIFNDGFVESATRNQLYDPSEAPSHFQRESVRTTKGYRTKFPDKVPSWYNPEYVAWRSAVLTRDGHMCVFCGSTEKLEADHIKPKSAFPDLKYDVSNGRTLCRPCHMKTATWGRKTSGLVEVETINGSTSTY
jgi:Restriction endonuclease